MSNEVKKQKKFSVLKATEGNEPIISNIPKGSKVLVKAKSEEQKEVPNNFLDYMEDYIDFHDETVINSDKVAAGNTKKPWVNFIVNTSGGIMVIPDLRDSDNVEAEGLTMEPGDALSLVSMYDIKIINRNKKGLITAMRTPSSTYKGLPQVLAVSSREKLEELPFNFLSPKSLAETLKERGKGSSILLPPNIHDKKLAEFIKEENDANDDLRREANNDNYDLAALESINDPDANLK